MPFSKNSFIFVDDFCIFRMHFGHERFQWRNQALFGQIFEWQQHTHPQHNGPCKCLLGQIAKPQKCSIFILFYLCLIRGLLNNHTQHAILYIELKPNICSFAPFDGAFCECASSVIRFCDSISANVDQVAAMKLTKIGFFFPVENEIVDRCRCFDFVPFSTKPFQIGWLKTAVNVYNETSNELALMEKMHRTDRSMEITFNYNIGNSEKRVSAFMMRWPIIYRYFSGLSHAYNKRLILLRV